MALLIACSISAPTYNANDNAVNNVYALVNSCGALKLQAIMPLRKIGSGYARLYVRIMFTVTEKPVTVMYSSLTVAYENLLYNTCMHSQVRPSMLSASV